MIQIILLVFSKMLIKENVKRHVYGLMKKWVNKQTDGDIDRKIGVLGI